MSVYTQSRKSFYTVSLLVLCLGLSACGYKAPLYIPTAEQQRKLDERDARIQARKQAASEAKTTQQSPHTTVSPKSGSTPPSSEQP